MRKKELGALLPDPKEQVRIVGDTLVLDKFEKEEFKERMCIRKNKEFLSYDRNKWYQKEYWSFYGYRKKEKYIGTVKGFYENKQPCQFATSQEAEKKEEKTEIQEAKAEEMMPVIQQDPIVLEEKRSIYMDVAVIQRLHRLLTAEEEQYIRELAGELEEREQR